MNVFDGGNHEKMPYNVPLSQFLMVWIDFYTILNYFLLRKSDVIKITRTHSMAMMMSDCLN